MGLGCALARQMGVAMQHCITHESSRRSQLHMRCLKPILSARSAICTRATESLVFQTQRLHSTVNQSPILHGKHTLAHLDLGALVVLNVVSTPPWITVLSISTFSLAHHIQRLSD